MESLEGRIGRLTPEQRREVEDFIDFLLLKDSVCQTRETRTPPPQVMMNTPPVLSADSSPALQQAPIRMQDLVIREESYQRPIPPDPVISPPNQSTASEDDWITHDYMDYGKFDPQSSPATEAVKKVKRKIVAREAEDKSRHLLDWVD